MFEKRKNSDKRTSISFILAIAFVAVGIFVGLQLGEKTSDEVSAEAVISTVDISGEWIGTYAADYAGQTRSDYRVVIAQNGNIINGITYFDVIDERDVYSEERIEGNINGNEIFYQEKEFITLVNDVPENRCMTQSTLTYQILNGQETLVGEWVKADWERAECNGISGRIILTRNGE